MERLRWQIAIQFVNEMIAHTREELHGPADLEHGIALHEAKQNEGEHTEHNHDHGQTHEHRSGSKSRGQDRREVVQVPNTHYTLLGRHPCTRTIGREYGTKLPQTEMSGSLGSSSITHPIGRHEHHNVDDGRAHREHGPNNGHGSRVSNIFRGIKLGMRGIAHLSGTHTTPTSHGVVQFAFHSEDTFQN